LELDTFLNRIKEIRAGIKSPYCVILVANKRDMYLTRTVDSQSGIKWAREKHIPYLEASARTRFNTDEIFKLAVYQTAYTLYDLPRQREPQRAKPVLGEVVQVVKSEKRKEVQIQREQGREVIVETTTSTRKVVRRSVGEDDKQLTLRERTEADPKPKSRSHRKAK
jgi:GTPase SAR1 family protein